jgi:hypothetical protein
MAARTYRLRLTQDGREFEVEGDKAFVLSMLKRYGPDAPPERSRPKSARTTEDAIAVISPTAGKSLSIREFIQQLDLKKHTDITLAFGFYLERHQGLREFTRADIHNCYYEAKLEPSNTSQMIIQNIKRGFLMPSKKSAEAGRSRYTLTSSGEAFIHSKLPRGD